jgi:hypothetical protein
MGRLDSTVDRTQELAPHGVEVDGVAQPQRERRDDRLGVVARPVEAPVDEALHAKPQGVEERCSSERRPAPAP